MHFTKTTKRPNNFGPFTVHRAPRVIIIRDVLTPVVTKPTDVKIAVIMSYSGREGFIFCAAELWAFEAFGMSSGTLERATVSGTVNPKAHFYIAFFFLLGI